MKQEITKKLVEKLFQKFLATLFLLLWVCSISAQERTISGTITDISGNPMPGVNISVKNTTSGVVTDINGKYSIKVPDSNSSLKISFVGYVTQEIQVGEKTIIDAQLNEDVKELNEVVVVGYGVQKKSDLTGSVASISGSSISRVPLAGVDQALQGRAAGVNVIQNSGMPGGGVTIQIRGLSSINGTSPLVIVDGVPGNLSNLNANDIESIEILKDASSAAIYGSSGGNGVILVSTKKGKAGKTNTSFNYYKGWQEPWKRMEMLNAQEYVTVANRINLLSNPANYKPFSTQPDTFKNYDWQDIMFRTAIMENADLSFSGGNDKSTFMISASYLSQEGILRKSDYQKYTFRINSEHKLNKWLKAGENVNYIQSKNIGYEEWQFQSEYNSPLLNVLKMYPFVAPYDSAGNWSKTPDNAGSPKIDEDVLNKTRNNYTTEASAFVELTPIKGLTYTSRVNGTLNFNVNDQFSKYYYYSQLANNPINSVSKSISQYYNWTWQNFANYNVSILSDHNVGIMAGFEAYSDVSKNISGKRNKLTSEAPEDQYLSAGQDVATADQLANGTGDHNRNMAYFGRFNYDYKGIFLLNSNFRRDYSSKFGPRKKSGDFPSLSLGLKFSEFDFIKDFNLISFGKVRYSYGKTGANAPYGFRYSPTVRNDINALKYIFDGVTLSQGAASVQMANPELHWESMVMTTYGLDLNFLNNKVAFSVEYFNKHNDGMIYSKDLLAATGVYQNPAYRSQLGGDARPIVNFGQIDNTGWEFTLGYKKQEGDLKANFDFNITFLKNKVVDVGGDTSFTGSVGVNLSNITILTEGIPVAQFYGYKTSGIFTEADSKIDSKGKVYIWNQPYKISTTGDTTYAQSKAKPGDLRYVDINKDGVINDKDKTVIGNPIPKFTFGFSCNLEYKGFDLNMIFQGCYGNKIFNGAKSELMTQTPGRNRLKDVLNQYYSPVYDANATLLDPGNTNTGLVRLDPKGENQNFGRVSDFFVEDGSYIRLKSIQLGYTIPKSIMDKVNVESLRIYIGAKNLITLTKYSGFDPEISSSNVLAQGIDKAGNYPQSIMFLTGINLKF